MLLKRSRVRCVAQASCPACSAGRLQRVDPSVVSVEAAWVGTHSSQVMNTSAVEPFRGSRIPGTAADVATGRLAPFASYGPLTVSAWRRIRLEHAEVIFPKWFTLPYAQSLRVAQAGETLRLHAYRKRSPRPVFSGRNASGILLACPVVRHQAWPTALEQRQTRPALPS